MVEMIVYLFLRLLEKGFRVAKWIAMDPLPPTIIGTLIAYGDTVFYDRVVRDRWKSPSSSKPFPRKSGSHMLLLLSLTFKSLALYFFVIAVLLTVYVRGYFTIARKMFMIGEIMVSVLMGTWTSGVLHEIKDAILINQQNPSIIPDQSLSNTESITVTRLDAQKYTLLHLLTGMLFTTFWKLSDAST